MCRDLAYHTVQPPEDIVGSATSHSQVASQTCVCKLIALFGSPITRNCVHDDYVFERKMELKKKRFSSCDFFLGGIGLFTPGLTWGDWDGGWGVKL